MADTKSRVCCSASASASASALSSISVSGLSDEQITCNNYILVGLNELDMVTLSAFGTSRSFCKFLNFGNFGGQVEFSY